MIKTVSVQELCEQLDTDAQTVLIDVRPPADFAQGHILEARNIPLGSIPLRQIMAEWGRETEGKPIYFVCQSGGRSQQLLDDLEEIGFRSAQCVAGGMIAWNALGLPIASASASADVAAGRPRWALVGSAWLMLVGCWLGLLVHKGFFAIPMLVAVEMLFRGLTGWPGLSSIFGWKKSESADRKGLRAS